MDYVIKARAACGLRAPARHGALQLHQAADCHTLAQHSMGLSLLPPGDRSPPPTPEDTY